MLQIPKPMYLFGNFQLVWLDFWIKPLLAQLQATGNLSKYFISMEWAEQNKLNHMKVRNPNMA